MDLAYDKVITSRRLVVRPYRLSDYEAWSKAMRERRAPVDKFDEGPPPPTHLTERAFKCRVDSYWSDAAIDQFYNYGVFDRKSGEHLGNVSIYVLQRDPMKWANLGYMIHNHKRGRGYAKEAAKLALKIAFKNLGLRRIEAVMELDHRASIAVAKSLGMRKEGVRRRFLPATRPRQSRSWVDAAVFATDRN